MQPDNLTIETCPECGADMPVQLGYVTWCDQCNYNVNPRQQKQEPPKQLIAKIYTRLGQKQGRALMERLLKAESLKPQLTASKLLAYLIATLVHLVTLAFVVVGIALPIWAKFNFFAIFGGVVLLLIAWMLRPRFGKVPEATTSREKLPALFELVDNIAQALDAPPVDGIVITGGFNASYAVCGLKQKRILFIGLPLWTILNHQERAALIGHELAHCVNGDPTRSIFVGTAIQALAEWYNLLRSQPRTRTIRVRSFFEVITTWAVNLITLILSIIPWVGVYLLSNLLWYETRRAEYLADQLSAKISGTPTAVSMLDKMHLGDSFVPALASVALNPTKERDAIEVFQQNIAALPARELERRRRVQELTLRRLDVTHPPSTYRIKLLKANPVDEPSLTLPDSLYEKVDQELGALRPAVNKLLIRNYQASIGG